MDSKNIPGFETERLEGKLERSISQRTFLWVIIFFGVVSSLLFARIFNLEIIKGSAMALRAENNHLRKVFIPANRGIIYDRQGKELAWNDVDGRFYNDLPGLSLLTGFVGMTSKEDIALNPDIYREDIVGKEGAEKIYDEILRGVSGSKIVEIDSKEDIISSNIQLDPKDGQNIKLSIDADIQSFAYSAMENVSKTYGFQGGAAVILNIENGEVLTITSYPEYEAEILAKGEPREKINQFLDDPQKPFLNRAVSGLYAPGSIIKPLIALAALEEGVIVPEKNILSTGSISIPNPYFPDKESVFRDWKAHGWVDMRRALAVSSDVYFYTIGGGYGNVGGLGITKIKKYAQLFGFGSGTGINLENEEIGVVPDPEQKKNIDPQDPIWRVGDTYNISIGQGNFQATPIQVAVYTAALANGGKILKPHLEFNRKQAEIKSVLPINSQNLQVVQEGMRKAVLEGTAVGLSGLKFNIAGKTGTSEIGSGKFVNSWFIGFFPYENPKFAIAVVLEKGPADNLIGATFVTRQILEWFFIHKSEYLNSL